MFEATARLSFRFRWPVLIGALALFIIGAVLSGGVFNELKPGGYDDPSTESFEARELSIERFGVGRADLVALYTAESGSVQDEALSAEISQRIAATIEQESVVLGLSFFNTGAPQFVSEDGTRTFAVFTLAGDEQAKLDVTDELRELLTAEGPVVTEFGGEIPVFEAFNHTVEADLQRAELIAFPITAILLLIIFRTVVAAAIPLLLGGLAIVLALTMLRFIAAATPISLFALNVVTVLGLGLAIDYSLFILNRYREEAHELGMEEAIVRAVGTTGKAVAFSGVTLATSLVGLFVFPQVFLRSMAIGGIAVAVLAVLIAIAILPALIGVLGPRLESLRLPWFGPEDEGRGPSEGGFWHTIAFGVMRRPVIIAVTVVAALLVLGVPFLRFNASTQDHRALGEDVEARRVSDILNSEFQPHETTPHLVLVQGDSLLTPEAIEELFTFNASLQEVPGIARVDSVFSLAPDLTLEQYQGLFANPGGIEDPELAQAVPLFLQEDVARFSLVSQFEIDDEETQDQVPDIRDIPEPEGTSVLLGGNAATLYDVKAGIISRVPLTLAIIALATFVVLFLVFGSVTLPFKAMLLNLMSLTASFGAVVFIFQDGRLEGLLGYTSLGTIDVTLPLLMFAVLFGLSMDYEVLMLSRVREEYLRTKDNTLAVARGLEKTGRLITSAALLLIVVIAAFATSSLAYMKALGVGMALAIAIDATIVRALLVPASMRLMGDWNWWAPAPLYALWEKIGLGDLEGHGPASKPSTVVVPAMAAAAPAAPDLEAVAAPPASAGAGAQREMAPATIVMPAERTRRTAYLIAKSGEMEGQTFQITEAITRVGRAPDNDIVIEDRLASGHHFSIERGDDDTFVVRDADSTNGTLIDGERTEQRAITRDVEITVGTTILELILVGGTAPAAPPTRIPSAVGATQIVSRPVKLSDYLVVVAGEEPGQLYHLEGDTIGIGRDPRNRIVLDDIKVSAFHARLQRGLDGGLIVEDWGSQNGSYLNGTLLVDAAALEEGDLLTIGDTTLQLKRVS